MSSIRKRGKYYHYKAYINGVEHRESLHTSDRAEAKYLQSIKDRQLLSNNNPFAYKTTPITAILDTYQKDRINYRSTRHSLDSFRRINGFLNHNNINFLSEITSICLTEYINSKITAEYSRYEANNIIKDVKAFINWCVRKKIIFESPVADVSKLPIEESPRRAYEGDELLELIAAAKSGMSKKQREKAKKSDYKPERLYPCVMTALYTGLRKSELFRMKWADIDFDNDTIMVPKTKSKKFKLVPIARDLKKILSPLRSDPDKNCFDITNYTRVLNRIFRNAGIKHDRGWHFFRHTNATHLLRSGVDIKTVAGILGHSSTNITQIYVHTTTESMKSAVNKLKFRHNLGTQKKKTSSV
jgi:site-specific recombinase XerD